LRAGTYIALAAALVLAAGQARAGQAPARVLLWACDDAPLEGSGFPGCGETAKALKIEMEGASLQVRSVGTDPAAVDPRAVTGAEGAVFMAWVVAGASGGYVLYAYDSINDLVLSKSVTALKPSELPDAAAVAFLYRNMLGTSLSSDLASIESDASLWSLAFPAEKVRTVQQVEGLDRPEPAGPRVIIATGYWLEGYPLAPAILHAAMLSIGVIVHPRVEVAVELGGTPVPLERRASGSDASVSLHLVDLEAWARARIASAGPFVLLAGGGLGLKLAIASLSSAAFEGGNAERTHAQGCFVTSILARVMLGGRVGLALELGVEALFNYKDYRLEPPEGSLDEPRSILALGPLGLLARLQLAFAI
jgi:hypothetical protein